MEMLFTLLCFHSWNFSHFLASENLLIPQLVEKLSNIGRPFKTFPFADDVRNFNIAKSFNYYFMKKLGREELRNIIVMLTFLHLFVVDEK